MSARFRRIATSSRRRTKGHVLEASRRDAASGNPVGWLVAQTDDISVVLPVDKKKKESSQGGKFFFLSGKKKFWFTVFLQRGQNVRNQSQSSRFHCPALTRTGRSWSETAWWRRIDAGSLNVSRSRMIWLNSGVLVWGARNLGPHRGCVRASAQPRLTYSGSGSSPSPSPGLLNLTPGLEMGCCSVPGTAVRRGKAWVHRSVFVANETRTTRWSTALGSWHGWTSRCTYFA